MTYKIAREKIHSKWKNVSNSQFHYICDHCINHFERICSENITHKTELKYIFSISCAFIQCLNVIPYNNIAELVTKWKSYIHSFSFFLSLLSYNYALDNCLVVQACTKEKVETSLFTGKWNNSSFLSQSSRTFFRLCQKSNQTISDSSTPFESGAN